MGRDRRTRTHGACLRPMVGAGYRMTTPAFVPGRTLNRRFYWSVVRPLLDQAYPHLAHSAALIGYGSDVLGVDTPMSTDHNWGPRFQLFLSPADYTQHAAELHD